MKNQNIRNLKRKSSNPRCEFSGRYVGSKPVILTENAVSYVRKMGYIVEEGFIWNKILTPNELNKQLRFNNDF